MHRSDSENNGPPHHVDRRVYFETTVLFELMRIYFNVFGPVETARYIAVSSLKIFWKEQCLGERGEARTGKRAFQITIC